MGIGVAGQPAYHGLSKSAHWCDDDPSVLSGRRGGRSGGCKDAALSSVPLAPFAFFPAARSPPTEKLGLTLSRFQIKADEAIRLDGTSQDAQYLS